MMYLLPVDVSKAAGYAEPATRHSEKAGQRMLGRPRACPHGSDPLRTRLAEELRPAPRPIVRRALNRERCSRAGWTGAGIEIHRDVSPSSGRYRSANCLLSAVAVLDIISNGRHGWINLGRDALLGSTTR